MLLRLDGTQQIIPVLSHTGICGVTILAQSHSIVITGDLHENIRIFGRAIRAENLAPKTIKTYMGAAEQFEKFIAGQGMPGNVADLHREHVEAFILDQLERHKPSTARCTPRTSPQRLCSWSNGRCRYLTRSRLG